MQQIVVTGMGAICPLGLNVEEFWKNLSAGNIITFGPIALLVIGHQFLKLNYL